MARIRFFPRRSDDREDINPFNAGDPVMPLDDVVPTRDKRVGTVSPCGRTERGGGTGSARRLRHRNQGPDRGQDRVQG